jgi:hypothetical protein
MNEIDRYVDRICNKFNESDKDIQILKEELKSNLNDEVCELKKQGFSEEESIKIALEDFGQENNVISEMTSIWKKKSDFTLMIVKLAIAIFIIGCVFAGARTIYKNISYLLFSISWIIGCIAFYQYINIQYKSILLIFIAICDISFGGFIMSVQFFPNQVKAAFFIIFGIILIIVLAMKAYFIKNKISKWK